MILIDISWKELHIKNKMFEILNKESKLNSQTAIWKPWLNRLKVLEMALKKVEQY